MEGLTLEQQRALAIAQARRRRAAESGPGNPEWEARTRARARGLEPVDADPTSGMSFADQTLAGLGLGGMELVRGAQQRLGLRDGEDTAQQRELDAALRDTPGGRTGEFAAPLLATLPASSARVLATLPGSAGFGAAYGALQPTESAGETAANIGLGGALGAGGQWVGNRFSNGLSSLMARRNAAAAQTTRAADVAPMQQAVQNANDAGLAIAPAASNPTALNRGMNSIVGKDMLARGARMQNPERTAALARQDLGVSESTPLSRETLENIRQEAGQVYADIARNQQRIVPDDQYVADLSAIEQRLASLSDDFPNFDVATRDAVKDLIDEVLVDGFSAQNAIGVIRRLRQRATAQFRLANGPTPNASAQSLGHATQDAADAVEEQMLRHLRATGNEAAAEAFDAARRRIAVTHTVEGVLDDAGRIDAMALRRQWRKDRPLSPGLEQIARAADSFGDTMRLPSGADAAQGFLWTGGIGGLGGYAAGGDFQSAAMGAVGLNAARSGLRGLLLSRMGQRATTMPYAGPNRLGTLMIKAPRYAAQRGGPLAAVMAVQNQ